MTIPPIELSTVVPLPRDRAFALFTEGMGTWWPQSHTVGDELGKAVASAVIEAEAGGEVYEVHADGKRHVWGRVLAWEPPARFMVTWHPGRDAAAATELEVRFTAVEGGTRVELEHRNWEARGDAAQRVREAYEAGWPPVVAAYERAAAVQVA